ncbi:predicted protein [Verticillium alfalfae VaMs.102]|uniref:Predicted protein n=1 Tax=Verticillium alfalfae (strain VaMs.102 / ATCC MYA-4576 / FGSC 10136) TaxID=526221 RepID=C9SE34_VERA1|nr:predicted protein [Verticillium alfalfae VaMs.102]EEY17281.1 predicted protein [Verticillium alfalfae VaMs.102]
MSEFWVKQSEEVFRTEGSQATDRYGVKTHPNSGARPSLFGPIGAFKPAMKFLEARDKDNKTLTGDTRHGQVAPCRQGHVDYCRGRGERGGDDPNKDLDGL